MMHGPLTDVDEAVARLRRALQSDTATEPFEIVLYSSNGQFRLFVFSERELKFRFAICRRPSVCRLSVVCLSVVCRLSSVTFVHPTQAIEIFGNVLRHLVPWPSLTFV